MALCGFPQLTYPVAALPLAGELLLWLSLVASTETVPKTCVHIRTATFIEPIPCPVKDSFSKIKFNCTMSDGSVIDIISREALQQSEMSRNDNIYVPGKTCQLGFTLVTDAAKCHWHCYGEINGTWMEVCSIDARPDAVCPTATAVTHRIDITTTLEPDKDKTQQQLATSTITTGKRMTSQTSTQVRSETMSPNTASNTRFDTSPKPNNQHTYQTVHESTHSNVTDQSLNIIMLIFVALVSLIFSIVLLFGIYRCCCRKDPLKKQVEGSCGDLEKALRIHSYMLVPSEIQKVCLSREDSKQDQVASSPDIQISVGCSEDRRGSAHVQFGAKPMCSEGSPLLQSHLSHSSNAEEKGEVFCSDGGRSGSLEKCSPCSPVNVTKSNHLESQIPHGDLHSHRPTTKAVAATPDAEHHQGEVQPLFDRSSKLAGIPVKSALGPPMASLQEFYATGTSSSEEDEPVDEDFCNAHHATPSLQGDAVAQQRYAYMDKARRTDTFDFVDTSSIESDCM